MPEYFFPDRESLIEDYRLAVISREASLLGRKEVLSGKAKFGIFGSGQELAQLILAKFIEKRDYRTGYYRDQTLLMAMGHYGVYNLFSSLYANTDETANPHSCGRQMIGHFSSKLLDQNGNWVDLSNNTHCISDISPTSGQMPRLLGLAFASKYYRQNKLPKHFDNFSNKGNEVVFGTIGNASTSEGHFFEIMNSAGVHQVPLVMSVWDDWYGISVENTIQTVKSNISSVMQGFQKEAHTNGIEILSVNGWDYKALWETYAKATTLARKYSIPVLVHVLELTQTIGHSSSGSHERYKSKQRLDWEAEHDCNKLFRKWLLNYTHNGKKNPITTEKILLQIEQEAIDFVLAERNRAWEDYLSPINKEQLYALTLVENLELKTTIPKLSENKQYLQKNVFFRKDILHPLKNILRDSLEYKNLPERQAILKWVQYYQTLNQERYSSHLYSQSAQSFENIAEIIPTYETDAKEVDGRIILRDNFDYIMSHRPEVVIFGEDVGKIGDVNQGLQGLQAKYGENRIFDTGIRESAIMGKGLGMALRGLRPIAELQYLDYVFYGLSVLSDDVSSLHYRTKGHQKAPLIVRTRGHRLEGIWHSGSPMATILHSTRGMYILVPRNMTQAAGMYNTLLETDNPAILIECLNAYRKKELYPNNIGLFRIPLGKVDILKKGADITLVTYGACCAIALEAALALENKNISVEVIDIQTLYPLDVENIVLESLAKTNKIIFLDEDVPGGVSAYLLDEFLIRRNGYHLLETKPLTISSQAHRPAYGTDGDYFSKPSVDIVYDMVYKLLSDYQPNIYPFFYE